MMKKQHLFLKIIIINLNIITFLFRFLIHKFFINIKTDEYFEMIYKNLTPFLMRAQDYIIIRLHTIHLYTYIIQTK